MKKLNLLCLLSLIAIGFSACYDEDEPWGDWSKIVSFPGRERVTAVSFQDASGKAYVGLGYNPDINTTPDKYLKDFYTFDGKSWNLIEGQDFPDRGRRGSVAFVIGDTAYVGAGYRGKSTIDPVEIYYSNFYKFVISKAEWAKDGDVYLTTDIAKDFPDNQSCKFWGGIGFEYNGKGYVGTGQCDGFLSNTLFEYDPATGKWSAENRPDGTSYKGDKRVGASVFKIGATKNDPGNVVVTLGATGTSNAVDVCVLNKSGWTLMRPLVNTDGEFNDHYASIPRSHAAAFSSSLNNNREYGFVMAGAGATKGFVYDLDYDRWHQVEDLAPQMSMMVGSVSFAINGKGFIVTGGSSVNSASHSRTWEYTPWILEEDYNDY